MATLQATEPGAVIGQGRQESEEFFLTAALLCSFAAVAMALVGLLSRWGFDSRAFWILQGLGTGLVLLNLPDLDDGSWFRNRAILPLYALGALIAASYVPPPVNRLLAAAAALLGGAFWLRNLGRWFHDGSVQPAAWRRLLPVLGLVLGVSLAGSFWGRFGNPLFEGVILAGEVCPDQLHYAAYSNMMLTYGIPSTGLDGVPFIPYHVGVHWVVARLSVLWVLDLTNSSTCTFR